MAADLDAQVDDLLAGMDNDPEAIGAASAADSVMPNEEQMQEYIRMLQEQMAQRSAVTAPGMSIPPFIFILAFIIFFSTIGWFSYKLIKSLSEKERKKEEKRRLKEMKKKK